MPLLTVQIWDATGNKRQDVEMPDDAPVQRLIAVLVDRMKFPQTGPDGQLLSYKLQHRRTGKQLLETQTLAEAGVVAADVLRLIPEITAGARSLSQSEIKDYEARWLPEGASDLWRRNCDRMERISSGESATELRPFSVHIAQIG